MITAGHCAEHAKSIEVYLGIVDTDYVDRIKPLIVPQESIFVHPMHDREWNANDIALLKLPTSVECHDSVKPIQLYHNVKDDLTGTAAMISGWGQTETSYRFSQHLMTTDTFILSRDDCIERMANLSFELRKPKLYGRDLQENEICVVPAATATGDSGAGMVLKDSGLLIGIDSWGPNGDEERFPTIVANVAYHYEWLQATMTAHSN